GPLRRRCENDLDAAAMFQPEVDALVEPALVAMVRRGIDGSLIALLSVDGDGKPHGARRRGTRLRALDAAAEPERGAGRRRHAKAEARSGRCDHGGPGAGAAQRLA